MFTPRHTNLESFSCSNFGNQRRLILGHFKSPKKGKAIPVQALRFPGAWDYRISR